MNWPVMKNCSPIGVDVGERYIKAVQFSRSGGKWRISAAAEMQRESHGDGITSADARRLRQQLSESGFRGNQIVLAVPGENLLTGIMELPPVDSGAPIEMLARSELARMHKCDSQSFEMASWQLPAPARAANTTFMMGAACTHAYADSLLDCFEAEGFRVERLEIQSQAMARACGPLLNASTGLAGILDLGWTALGLVLLYNGVIIYERKLPKSAYGTMIDELAGELGVEAPKIEKMLSGEDRTESSAKTVGACLERYVARIVEETRIPLSYVSNQYPDATPDRLLLVGGGAKLDGLATRLAEAMDWPVTAATMSELAEGPESLDRDYGTTLIIATGLAWAEED